MGRELNRRDPAVAAVVGVESFGSVSPTRDRAWVECDRLSKEGGDAFMADATVASLHCRAQTALSTSPIYELRDLRVEQHNGSLLISGSVSSFYHKQLAQEVVRAVCSHAHVEVMNQIEVR